MKRQISFALAALMALSLAACGGSKENSSKGSTAAQGSEGQKVEDRIPGTFDGRSCRLRECRSERCGDCH